MPRASSRVISESTESVCADPKLKITSAEPVYGRFWPSIMKTGEFMEGMLISLAPKPDDLRFALVESKLFT
jgi:hypothetical protein